MSTSTSHTRQVIRDFIRTCVKMSNVSPAKPTFEPTLSPQRGDIRPIKDHPLNYREKYDGYRWRLVCTWSETFCSNFMNTRRLCKRHNRLSKNDSTKQKTKNVQTENMAATSTGEIDNGTALGSSMSSRFAPVKISMDDDDLQIIAEIPANSTMNDSNNSRIKVENSHYRHFAIDSPDPLNEPSAQTSHQIPPTSTNDVEYMGLKTNFHPLNIVDSVDKKVPPLTEFEEEYLSTSLIQNLSMTCSMVDAQLYLHKEAIRLVQKNYRMKMESISSEYFFDFLLRHPHVPLHFQHWFNRCKPIIPTTGCPIDMKIWTISMMIRGSQSFETPDEAI